MHNVKLKSYFGINLQQNKKLQKINYKARFLIQT